MKSVHKTAILGYSAEKMYALVEDVAKYPEFLPWCSKTRLMHDEAHHAMLATLTIDFHGFTHSFTTRNHNQAPVSITMQLEKGPFSHLDGKWTFTQLTEGKSRIDLVMNYKFSNSLFEKLLAPVFDMVSNSLVDAFCQRARTVYG